jgi:hypothetical protein
MKLMKRFNMHLRRLAFKKEGPLKSMLNLVWGLPNVLKNW